MVNKKNILPLAVATVGILFSIFYESRSFVLGFSAALICFLFSTQIIGSRVRYKWFLAIGFIALVVLLAFGMKTGSTKGRVLIYKISADMFADHFLTGVGTGNFKHHYLHYQAQYFGQGRFTQEELLLADNTYFAFNDYWQLVLEWGIIGGVLLLLVGMFIFYMAIQVCRSNVRLWPMYGTAAVFLIAIALAACFNHVFEQFYIQITFFICLSIILQGYIIRFTRVSALACISMLLFIGGVLVFAEFSHKILAKKAYKHWYEGEVMLRLGYVNESLENFEKAYPSLQSNGTFLVGYADLLTSISRFEEAITKYDEALKLRVHNSIYITLAHCYYELGLLEDAEQALVYAVHMVPNRFESRLALFDFYMETDRTAEAREWGKSILDLPIKVPSTHIDQIKRDVAQRIPEKK